jgi:UDP-N-acetylmuramoyl-tripeptide--D-alanyl-D-alanine ligase
VLLEFSTLARSVGADMLSFGEAQACGFSSVSIDSRSVEEGGLFAALSGAVHDGHSFVESAFKNGAAAALVERAKVKTLSLDSLAKSWGKTLIMVDNTLKGLQDAARVYLERFPHLLKIGITGSSGKTTTKEITAAMIGAEKSAVMNPGNYNSEIGLPLAVFGVRRWHEAGIFEMGMNHRGEIADLAVVLKPNIALITNINSAHIGNIGSMEAIAEEKKKIFSQMGETDIALIPEDSPFRDFLAEGVKGKVSFYGEKSFAEWGGVKTLGLEGSEITWEGQRIRFALPGRYNLANAFAAIAIAQKVPVSAAAIRQGLESASPLFGRGEILRGRVTVIHDCYNANPESVAQALEFCESLDWPGRRIYIIGEMLELGEKSPQAHETLGRLLAESKADMVFLFGKEIKSAAEILKDCTIPFVMHTRDMNELSRTLDSCVHNGDLVLLKGSRGCALERLCAVLIPSHEAVAAASSEVA